MSLKLAETPRKAPTLSDEVVQNLIHIYKNSKVNQRDLAKSHGISKSTLNRILKAKNVAIRKDETPSKCIFPDLWISFNSC